MRKEHDNLIAFWTGGGESESDKDDLVGAGMDGGEDEMSDEEEEERRRRGGRGGRSGGRGRDGGRRRRNGDMDDDDDEEKEDDRSSGTEADVHDKHDKHSTPNQQAKNSATTATATTMLTTPTTHTTSAMIKILTRVHLHRVQISIVGVPVPDEPSSNGHVVRLRLDELEMWNQRSRPLKPSTGSNGNSGSSGNSGNSGSSSSTEPRAEAYISLEGTSLTVTPRSRKKDSGGGSSKSSGRRNGGRPTTGITGEIGIRRVDFVGLRAVSYLLLLLLFVCCLFVCLCVCEKNNFFPTHIKKSCLFFSFFLPTTAPR